MTRVPAWPVALAVVVACACGSARRPRATASPDVLRTAPWAPPPFAAAEPTYGPSPADPWPPPSFDTSHWLGPGTGMAHPFALPTGGSVASDGCPFPVLALPPCPDDIAGYPGVELVLHAEFENRVVNAVGILRGHVTHSFSWDFLRPSERVRGVLVRGLGQMWLGLELLDRAPNWNSDGPILGPEPRFLCYGDETGVCCTLPSDRRVVARGRIQSEVSTYLYAPLLCDLGERPVRVLHFTSHAKEEPSP